MASMAKWEVPDAMKVMLLLMAEILNKTCLPVCILFGF